MKMGDRIRTDAYSKKPGIWSSYSIGTDQAKGPDKAEKKQMGNLRRSQATICRSTLQLLAARMNPDIQLADC